MNWLEEIKEVNWAKLLDDDSPIVVSIRRDGVSDVVCGRLVMVSSKGGELEIESFHQGRFPFYDYEVEKVLLILGDV